jgi:7-alpha-hydroxysteroid dehydrogenase
MTASPEEHPTPARVLDAFRLTAKVSIVTGAGRGIGAEVARTLAAAGSDVVIVARSSEDLESVATHIRGCGRRALALTADLREPTAPGMVVDRTLAEFGRIDVLVNNFGGTNPKPIADTGAEYLQEAFRTDVVIGYDLTRAALRALLVSGDAAVVNMSSAMAHNPDRGMAAAGAAKAALSYLTTLLAQDLGPRVRVNAVAPGSIATPALLRHYSPEALAAKLGRTPLRRLGTPADIALAVLYLASPASSFVTGKTLEVDGGVEAPNSPSSLPDLAPRDPLTER